MKHTIATPPQWPRLEDLKKFLGGRFAGHTFEFTLDGAVTLPECVQSRTPPELVLRNSENGETCIYPMSGEINCAINEFIEDQS